MSTAALTITLTLAPAQELLLRAQETLRTGLGPGLTVGAEAVVKEHLVDHYTTRPNKLGGATTGYWQGVHDKAAAETKGGGGNYATSVTLTGVGLRMKLEGGVVRPSGRTSSVTGKPIKYLTIPVIAEAHGKSASDFPFLKARGKFAEGGGGVLYAPREGSSFGTVFFVLVKSVTIKPDPNILPPAEAVLAEMAAGVRAVMSSFTTST